MEHLPKAGRNRQNPSYLFSGPALHAHKPRLQLAWLLYNQSRQRRYFVGGLYANSNGQM